MQVEEKSNMFRERQGSVYSGGWIEPCYGWELSWPSNGLQERKWEETEQRKTFLGNSYEYRFLKRVKQFNDNTNAEQMWYVAIYSWGGPYMFLFGVRFGGFKGPHCSLISISLPGGSNTHRHTPLILTAWADKIKGVSSVERLHELPKLIVRICVKGRSCLLS